MSLRDWTNAKPAGPLTEDKLREQMNAALRSSKITPTHDCRLDGHVVALLTTRCLYCGRETT